MVWGVRRIPLCIGLPSISKSPAQHTPNRRSDTSIAVLAIAAREMRRHGRKVRATWEVGEGSSVPESDNSELESLILGLVAKLFVMNRLYKRLAKIRASPRG